jgi:hypothetical protein
MKKKGNKCCRFSVRTQQLRILKRHKIRVKGRARRGERRKKVLRKKTAQRKKTMMISRVRIKKRMKINNIIIIIKI